MRPTWTERLVQISSQHAEIDLLPPDLNTTTRNTTTAKPREDRFGYTWFVCDLKFQGWCSKSGPKSNTHCASYIVDELTADHTDKLENGRQFSVNGKLKR